MARRHSLPPLAAAARPLAVVASLCLASCTGGDDDGSGRAVTVDESVAELRDTDAELRAAIDDLEDRVADIEQQGPPAASGEAVDALCNEFDRVIGQSITPAMGEYNTFVEGYVRFVPDTMELLAIYDGVQGHPTGEVLDAGALLFRFPTAPPPPGESYNLDWTGSERRATSDEIEQWPDYDVVLDGECHAIDRDPSEPSAMVELALQVANGEAALPPGEPPPPLTDPTHAALADRCHAGELEACDELYAITGSGSIDAEIHGDTCGRRRPLEQPSSCVEQFG